MWNGSASVVTNTSTIVPYLNTLTLRTTIIPLSLSLSLDVLTAIFQVNLVSRCLLKQRIMEAVVTSSEKICIVINYCAHGLH